MARVKPQQLQLKRTCIVGGSPLLPGGTVVRLHAHDEEDGVPASPADKGAPNDKGIKPLENKKLG